VRLVGKTGSASELGLWFSIPLRIVIDRGKNYREKGERIAEL